MPQDCHLQHEEPPQEITLRALYDLLADTNAIARQMRGDFDTLKKSVTVLEGRPMFDSENCCEFLDCSDRSLRRHRQDYGLEVVRIGRKSYYYRDEIRALKERLIERGRQDGD